MLGDFLLWFARRSVKCPQHTEEQRQEIRSILITSSESVHLCGWQWHTHLSSPFISAQHKISVVCLLFSIFICLFVCRKEEVLGREPSFSSQEVKDVSVQEELVP